MLRLWIYSVFTLINSDLWTSPSLQLPLHHWNLSVFIYALLYLTSKRGSFDIIFDTDLRNWTTTNNSSIVVLYIVSIQHTTVHTNSNGWSVLNLPVTKQDSLTSSSTLRPSCQPRKHIYLIPLSPPIKMILHLRQNCLPKSKNNRSVRKKSFNVNYTHSTRKFLGESP